MNLYQSQINGGVLCMFLETSGIVRISLLSGVRIFLLSGVQAHFYVLFIKFTFLFRSCQPLYSNSHSFPDTFHCNCLIHINNKSNYGVVTIICPNRLQVNLKTKKIETNLHSITHKQFRKIILNF